MDAAKVRWHTADMFIALKPIVSANLGRN